jgi:hypothetical protein
VEMRAFPAVTMKARLPISASLQAITLLLA